MIKRVLNWFRSAPVTRTSQAHPRATAAGNRRVAVTSRPGRYTALGYRAAEVLRKSGNALPEEGSADYHTRDDRTLLIDQARSFNRDNGFYRGVKGRALDNILGSGFTLQADTGSDRLNARLESEWKTYGEAPELRRLHDWHALERFALAELIDAGDFLAVKTGQGLQMIKAERIATTQDDEETEQGVHLDAAGRPIGFYVSRFDHNGLLDEASAEYRSADECVYVANLESWDQTRGMPAQVSNFPMFHRISDIADSEAQAWQLLAKFAIAVNVQNAVDEAEAAGESDSSATSSSLADRVQDVGGGLFFYGEPGEEMKGVERNVPGSNFVESLTMFVRCLGLPLGLPLELILLDWSKLNYSQSRAALEQAYRNFKCWQRLLYSRFHAPVYKWRVAHWIAEGLVPNRPETYRHHWTCPEFPWVDQLKEAQSWEKRISSGLSTHGEALASLNRDRREYLDQREQEIRTAIDVADRINEDYPSANVDWRPLAGVQSSKTANKPAEKPEPEESTEPPAEPTDEKGDPDNADD